VGDKNIYLEPLDSQQPMVSFHQLAFARNAFRSDFDCPKNWFPKFTFDFTDQQHVLGVPNRKLNYCHGPNGWMLGSLLGRQTRKINIEHCQKPGKHNISRVTWGRGSSREDQEVFRPDATVMDTHGHVPGSVCCSTIVEWNTRTFSTLIIPSAKFANR
jgi:hypothetical protein